MKEREHASVHEWEEGQRERQRLNQLSHPGAPIVPSSSQACSEN